MDVRNPAIVGRLKTKTPQRARNILEDRAQGRIIAIGEQQAIPWNEIEKSFKSELDRGQVVEDVRMIEFEIVDDGHLGKIVDELAPLIEERGVVFIAVDHKPFDFVELR